MWLLVFPDSYVLTIRINVDDGASVGETVRELRVILTPVVWLGIVGYKEMTYLSMFLSPSDTSETSTDTSSFH